MHRRLPDALWRNAGLHFYSRTGHLDAVLGLESEEEVADKGDREARRVSEARL